MCAVSSEGLVGFVRSSWTAPSEAVEDPLHEPRERKGCSRTHLPCYAVLVLRWVLCQLSFCRKEARVTVCGDDFREPGMGAQRRSPCPHHTV